MNCEQANQMDLVDYLSLLGYSPKKIVGNNYWYHSPFRQERTPSFKIDRAKNLWYDFGEDKGGKTVDFAKLLFNCDTSDALARIETGQIVPPTSFQQQRNQRVITDTSEDNSIKILEVKNSISSLTLQHYLKQRHIPLSIAELFCKQVDYQSGQYNFTAIGFKNNAGGYELRSERFKGSSSPKYVTYYDNKASSISVFEGMFDFLSWQTINKNQQTEPSNFLILNSLSFFERSMLLMEKHTQIHLYLDQDKRGRACTEQLQQRAANIRTGINNVSKVTDESKLYKGYKDLNEWVVNFGKQLRTDQSRGIHL